MGGSGREALSSQTAMLPFQVYSSILHKKIVEWLLHFFSLTTISKRSSAVLLFCISDEWSYVNTYLWYIAYTHLHYKCMYANLVFFTKVMVTLINDKNQEIQYQTSEEQGTILTSKEKGIQIILHRRDCLMLKFRSSYKTTSSTRKWWEINSMQKCYHFNSRPWCPLDFRSLSVPSSGTKEHQTSVIMCRQLAAHKNSDLKHTALGSELQAFETIMDSQV